MSKYIKGLVQKELETLVSESGVRDFVVFSVLGVGGVSSNLMRGDLKAKGLGVFVVKNSLWRKVLQNNDMEAATDLFKGQCVVAYGGDSVVEVARELVYWRKKIKQIEIKGGFVEGTTLDAAGVDSLSMMPSRVELQGEVVTLANSPGSRVASCIVSPASVIAGCVETLIENLEKEAA
jgi:ribosomal protein L10